ncbi:uncharacterized protein LOC104439124 [Eucalyptus grandis]|uniref:uncharacterized protein LOC104439124 n=1 Tax=Eucalyptus grandis TaxID=71139 RepID=UPI00192F1090|nr:uncharacterized protein LOC104439124 [Eucalyptus grandis]
MPTPTSASPQPDALSTSAEASTVVRLRTLLISHGVLVGYRSSFSVFDYLFSLLFGRICSGDSSVVTCFFDLVDFFAVSSAAFFGWMTATLIDFYINAVALLIVRENMQIANAQISSYNSSMAVADDAGDDGDNEASLCDISILDPHRRKGKGISYGRLKSSTEKKKKKIYQRNVPNANRQSSHGSSALSLSASSSLRSQNSVPCLSSSGSSSSSSAISSSRWCWLGCKNVSSLRAGGNVGRGGNGVVVKCSVDTTGVYTVGKVTEVDKDTFWPIVNSAFDKTVVLDMYTQWCGPCKIIAPKFQELAEKYLDVVFLKLDCKLENKPLAKELGIRVVPTFKILKGGKIVKEVTGAKFDDLLLAIDTVRSS